MGFDIVIGNPPYISAPTMEAPSNPKLSEIRKRVRADARYRTLSYQWDLYVPFMELGMQLIKDDGAFGMIVPYPIASQNYAKGIRRLFCEEHDVFEIADLHEEKIFGRAVVQNCIVFAVKGQTKHVSAISKIDNKKIVPFLERPHEELFIDTKSYVWDLSERAADIIRHPEMPSIGDICYISFGLVLNADEKRAKGLFSKGDLLSDIPDDIHVKKYIEGKDIEKYVIKRTRYLEWGTDRCPGLIRRVTFPELYTAPKIMINVMGDVKAILDKDGEYYCSDLNIIAIRWEDLHGITNKSIEGSIKKNSSLSRSEMDEMSKRFKTAYISAVINSRYGAALLNDIRGGDFNIYPNHIRQIPIAPATPEQQAEIVALVDSILAAKEADPDADISSQMAAIDEKVYALYGVEPPKERA